MMAARGYRFKKDLKASVGQRLSYTETSLMCSEYVRNGDITLVGPSAHERKWYAVVTMEDGLITEVR